MVSMLSPANKRNSLNFYNDVCIIFFSSRKSTFGLYQLKKFPLFINGYFNTNYGTLNFFNRGNVFKILVRCSGKLKYFGKLGGLHFTKLAKRPSNI